jgi:hypothetical protein
MQNIQRTLSFIGPEYPQSSSSERASNTIVRRWLLRLASFALTVVTLGTLGVPAQAQGFFEKGSTCPLSLPKTSFVRILAHEELLR